METDIADFICFIGDQDQVLLGEHHVGRHIELFCTSFPEIHDFRISGLLIPIHLSVGGGLEDPGNRFLIEILETAGQFEDKLFHLVPSFNFLQQALVQIEEISHVVDGVLLRTLVDGSFNPVLTLILFLVFNGDTEFRQQDGIESFAR